MSSKVIIVTGASRGLGLAITHWLLKNSHKVVAVSRSEAPLKAIKDEFPDQVAYLAADLTDLSVAPKITELAIKTYGRLDGLVVNHGVVTPIKRIIDSDIGEWKQVYDANMFSALALVQAAIPALRDTKGRIVFVSSGAALHGYVAWGAYGSSKAAMNSLAQHIAVEEPSIATVAIGPGRVDTDMQKDIRETGNNMDGAVHAEFIEAFEKGKLNKPEWPGNVIARLAVEAKTDLNGEYHNWNAPQLAAYQDN